MRYRVERHPLVAWDFQQIDDLIWPYAGAETAQRTLLEIEKRIAALTNMPKVGSIRNEFGLNVRSIPVKKAVITFEVDDRAERVYVLCVTYAGADWTQRVKGRRS